MSLCRRRRRRRRHITSSLAVTAASAASRIPLRTSSMLLWIAALSTLWLASISVGPACSNRPSMLTWTGLDSKLVVFYISIYRRTGTGVVRLGRHGYSGYLAQGMFRVMFLSTPRVTLMGRLSASSALLFSWRFFSSILPDQTPSWGWCVCVGWGWGGVLDADWREPRVILVLSRRACHGTFRFSPERPSTYCPRLSVRLF